MAGLRQRGAPCHNGDHVSTETRNEAAITAAQKGSVPELSVKSKDHGFKTLTWDEIEPWQQDNHFIVRGYRPATNSYTKSVKSLAHAHNQTVNIWSHLLGALAFLTSAAIVYRIHVSQLHEATEFDLLLFAQFYLGVVVCLTFSAAFHTFGNHSDDIYHSFLLCDLAGIILLTTSSFYPGIYYGFYCEPSIVRFYWTMITVFGAGALVACLVPKFRTNAWRPLRTTMLIFMGLSGVFPMTHAASRFGIIQARLQMGWDWYIAEGVFYLSGALIYAAKVPERWKPGRFDLWGSSHQIFHICVLLGAACHLTGAVNAFNYNHNPATRRC